MTKETKGEVVSFRLSSDEFEPFRKEMERLSLSKSQYFRLLVTGKMEESLSSGHNTKDYKRCLFYMNKTSNNMNQIAKRLNSENRSGVVKEATFIKAMNALLSIRNVLSKVLE